MKKPVTDPVAVLADATMRVIEAHGFPDQIRVSQDPEGMPTVHVMYGDNSDQGSHSGRGPSYSLSDVKSGGKSCRYVFAADREKDKKVH